MFTVLDLFSGIGGITLGLESTGGFRTVAFCEIEPFCREVLKAHWPEVPCFTDVRRLRAERNEVDVVVGGFPCQPHSVAGKREGSKDARHLWPEFARLVREVRPRWVLAENVPGLRTTAADEVLADLEGVGYACWPLVVGAWAVGAPHRRERVWIVAHRARDGQRVESAPERADRERAGAGGDARVADADAALREQSGRGGRTGGAGAPKSGGSGAPLAHGDGEGRGGERSGGLLDGEREASGDDADGRGSRPVGDAKRAGLRAGGEREARGADARRSDLGEPIGGGLARLGQRYSGALAAAPSLRWPARPGQPQHEWEEPRLRAAIGREEIWTFADERLGIPAERIGVVYAPKQPRRRVGQPREGSDPGRPELPLGGAAHGLSERLARRANRESLKALGNSVVPQVVRAIGFAVLEAEERLRCS